MSNRPRTPIAPPATQALETLDPAALAQVSGGAAAGGGDAAVVTALTGILESLQSLAGSRQRSGFDPAQFMMMMMVMNGRPSGGVVQAAAPATPIIQQVPWCGTPNGSGGYSF